MPSLPLFPPEPQAVQTPPGKGKSKSAKARKRRKAAVEAAVNTPAVAADLPKLDPIPKPQGHSTAAPGASSQRTVHKVSSPPSDILSQSLPSLSSYQNSTPPPLSPQLPKAAGASTSPRGDADDGFIVVTHSKRPKTQWNPTQHEEEANKLQFWWNDGFRPPDETWDWEHGDDRRTHKVETWLEALQQLTLDPPETPVIEHVVEPKQSVVPKRVLRQMGTIAAQAVPKPKPQVRWGK